MLELATVIGLTIVWGILIKGAVMQQKMMTTSVQGTPSQRKQLFGMKALPISHTDLVNMEGQGLNINVGLTYGDQQQFPWSASYDPSDIVFQVQKQNAQANDNGLTSVYPLFEKSENITIPEREIHYVIRRPLM